MKQKLIALMAIMLAVVSPTWADEAVLTATAKIGDIYYNLYSDGHAEVGINTVFQGNADGYDYSGTDLVIPETVSYKVNEEDEEETTFNVTAIAENAFYYNYNNYRRNTTVRTIRIPNSVKTIGNSAFSYMDNLTTIYFDVVEGCEIGSFSFYGLPSTCQLVLGSNVTEYPSYISKGISPTSVTIPAQITKIGDYAFRLCSNLTSVTFESDENLTVIGENAFSNCSKLTEIELPNSVQTIGDNAFANCSQLSSIKFPSNLQTIGTFAFNYCEAFTSLVLPEGLQTIDKNAFRNCTNLATVTIPSTVTTIGQYAFDYCKNLMTLYVLCTTAPTLQSSTFYGTLSQKTLYVRRASRESFENTSYWNNMMIRQLPSVKYYTSGNSAITPNGTNAFGEDLSILGNLLDGEEDGLNVGYFELSGNPTAIASGAFSGKTALTGIEIPSTVTEIGDDAFSGCSNLSQITFVTTSKPTISASAFTGTPSGTVYVREVAKSSFGNEWEGKTVQSLKNIKYTTSNGSTLEPNVKSGYGTDVAYIGTFYDGVDGENTFGYIEFKGTPTVFPERAFYSSSRLKSITIPEKVTKLSKLTFQFCSNLESVSFESDENLLEIGEEAFDYCDNMKSIKLPNSVTTIGEAAFSRCHILETVELPEGLLKICKDAFYNCAITEVTIPSTLTSLGSYAFGSCNNLESTYLLTPTAPEVGEYPFSNNASMKLYVREAATGFGTNWGGRYIYKLPNIKYTSSDGNAVKPKALSGFGENVKCLGSYYDGNDGGDKFGYLEFTGNPTAIPDEAFKQTSLSWIDIPADVTTIGEDAFDGCSMTGVTYGGQFADWCAIDFGNEKANPMSGMTFPANIPNGSGGLIPTTLEITGTAVKPYTFVNTGITSLDLGNVTAIGDGAFSGCASLATINVGETPATLGEDAFDGISSGHVVNVPLAAYMTYTATAWNDLNLIPQAGTLDLTDETEYTIAFDLDDCDISYTRTVSNNNWMGVYLPFEVDVTKVDGTYATLMSVSEGYLNWETQESGTIPACTPFIYKPTEFEAGEETRDIEFSANPVKLYSCETTPNSVTADGYTLNGNFTEITTMATLGAYALASNVFKQADSDGKHLKPFRVYIVANTPNNAPALRCRINGEDVTGISLTPALPSREGESYNLQGIRVDDSYKGIVIVNGKKVIRK